MQSVSFDGSAKTDSQLVLIEWGPLDSVLVVEPAIGSERVVAVIKIARSVKVSASRRRYQVNVRRPAPQCSIGNGCRDREFRDLIQHDQVRREETVIANIVIPDIDTVQRAECLASLLLQPAVQELARQGSNICDDGKAGWCLDQCDRQRRRPI